MHVNSHFVSGTSVAELTPSSLADSQAEKQSFSSKWIVNSWKWKKKKV